MSAPARGRRTQTGQIRPAGDSARFGPLPLSSSQSWRHAPHPQLKTKTKTPSTQSLGFFRQPCSLTHHTRTLRRRPHSKYTRYSALQLSTYTSHLRPHHTHEHITPNDIHTPHLHAQEPLNIHNLKAHIKTSLMNSLTHYTPQQTPPVNSHWHGTSKGKYTPNTHIHMSFNRHIHTYAHCTHIHTHHSTTTNPGRNHTSNTPTSRSHPHRHIIIRQERATYKRAHTNTAQTHALCPRANQIHSTPSTRAKTCAAHTHPTPSHTLNAHTDVPHPRARTHAYMHTYIHTQPAPSFPPGGREGGEEGRRGRKEGGWAREAVQAQTLFSL